MVLVLMLMLRQTLIVRTLIVLLQVREMLLQLLRLLRLLLHDHLLVRCSVVPLRLS